MGWNGSGVVVRSNGEYSGDNVWAQDLANAKKITAARHDTHDEDLADAIQACLNLNAENAMLADLDMGNFDLANLSVAGGVLKYGTWVPNWEDGSWVSGSEWGVYAQIGKLVLCAGRITKTDLVVAGSGSATIVSLPVTVGSGGGTGIVTNWNAEVSPTGSAPHEIAPVAASTTAVIQSSGGVGGFLYTDFVDDPEVKFLFAYTA